MSGTVYTYNILGEPGALSLNGDRNAKTIPPNKGPAGQFVPNVLAVESAKHDDEDTGKWYRGGDGGNDLRVTWDSGYSHSAGFKMPTIDDRVSIDDDLVVYIGKDRATVQTVDGLYLSSQPLDFTTTK